MTVLPADRQLDLRKLERFTHERAALLSEGEFASFFPDCAVGAMPPFGNLYGLPTLRRPAPRRGGLHRV